MKILAASILTAVFVLPFHPGICQKQGIRGQVLWFSGNQMPGPGRELAPELGIKREIHIYELTTMEDVRQEETFFSDIQTRLVTTFFSKDNGRFKVRLPPGRYSVFVKEPKGLFANLFMGNGEINPVTVEEKRFTWMTITIDYEAAY